MKKGFTLVEMLLAITLIAIIITVLYGVLEQTLGAQGRIEAVMYGSEIGPHLLNQIRQDIEACFVPDDKKTYFLGQDKKDIGGDADRVDFVSSTLDLKEEQGKDPAFSAINEVGYQLKPNRERSGVLVLYRRLDYGIDDDALKGGRLYELYDRVKSLNVEFYDGKDWQPSWDNKELKKLPEAVRVELVIQVNTDLEEDKPEDRKYSTIITLPAPPPK